MKDLSRRYGPRVVLDRVNFVVPAGSVYGFLGPNGSGKTTAMRCMLGLIRADSGDVAFFGETDPVRRLAKVGALVETPRFYNWLSGRANLEIACAYAGFDPRATVDEALDRVELRPRADDKVIGYSLGMQQRLGIAQALLGKPRVILLDEPTNGLDPQGMKLVRDVLRRLAQQDGMTVFISSHLLSEVQAIADHVGILQKGRLLAEGSVRELLAGGESAVEIGGPEPERLHAALERLPGVRVVGTAEGGRFVAEGMEAAALNAALQAQGVPVNALLPRARSLEDLFLSLTGTGGNL